MQRSKKIRKKIKKIKKKPPKNEKQNFEKEKERDITFCLQENYIKNERDNCKFIVRKGE